LAAAEEEDDATSKMVEQQQQQQPPPPPPANQNQGHAQVRQDMKPEPREEAVDVAVEQPQPQPQLLSQGVLPNGAATASAVFHDQVFITPCLLYASLNIFSYLSGMTGRQSYRSCEEDL